MMQILEREQKESGCGAGTECQTLIEFHIVNIVSVSVSWCLIQIVLSLLPVEYGDDNGGRVQRVVHSAELTSTN